MRQPYLLISILCVLSVAACGRRDSHESHGSTRLEFVDALGDTLRINEPPRRIVSLAPSTTELVFALGAGDRLVGVTTFCDYPPEAKTKTKVGGFNAISKEQILAVKPDLILASRGNSKEDLADIRRMGVGTFAIEINSVNDLLTTARTLGRLLAMNDETNEIIAGWQDTLAQVDSISTIIAAKERPRVFFGGTSEPIWSAAPGSYINDIMTRAGGMNVLGAEYTSWPRVDLETLVKLDPDVLIATYHSSPDRAIILKRLRSSPGWNSLKAVKTGRVIFADDGMLRPGPRMIQSALHVAEKLNAFSAATR